MDSGVSSIWARGAFRYSTAAANEEPIKPPVEVEYTKLLINGEFVDSVSGDSFLLLINVIFLSLKKAMIYS